MKNSHKMPDGKMMKDSAMKKMAHGGMVAGVGQSQGETLSQNVKKSVQGDKVAVRGVGAARARTAMIY
jgi:hypothetical protein